MSRFLSLVVGVLVALWCAPTWATDGDACDLTDWQVTRGTVKTVWCVQICDGKDSQDSACSEIDLMDLAVGIPDVLVFEIDADTGCSAAASATFTSSPETAGTEHDLGGTTSVTRGVNTKLTIDTTVAPVDRYIMTDLADVDGCTNFDVLMVGYEKQVSR